MPKSSKKKGKVADFTRAKLKLGKGKAQPTNAVDTSFKARSITLPSQSITIQRDGFEPLTKRHLAFGDLLSHFKHYNAGTRRDGILGLKELLTSNWELIESCLAPLLTAVARLISDEDASVRKQLILFLSWLLPRIPPDDLIPHSPHLLLYTTSAQSHIFPEIRIDAIRLLDVLLECIPQAITAGWSESKEGHGSRVLGGFLGVLNAGNKYGEQDGPVKVTSTSTASVVLTPASKLVVLRSFSSFLRTCLSSSLESSPPTTKDDAIHFWNKPLHAWFMESAFSSPEAFLMFDELFTPAYQSRNAKCMRGVWQAQEEVGDEDSNQFTQCFAMLGNTSGESGMSLLDLQDVSEVNKGWKSQSTQANVVAHLAHTLHSTIIETYLDCAPSVFSPGSNPSETELQLVITVIQITQTLYQHIIQTLQDVDTVHIEHLRSIVNYMAPYFPASIGKDIKTDQIFEEFNLSFCGLTSLLVKASEMPSSIFLNTQKKRHRKSKKSSSRDSSLLTDRVTEYVIRRLSGTSSGIAVPITPAAYVALLPSVWALISNGDAAGKGRGCGQTELLLAILDHAMNVPSKSPCKRATMEFVGKLTLLDTSPHYLGTFSLASFELDSSLKQRFESWLLHLPQVLWEIGTNNNSLSEIILRVLLRIFQRRFSFTRPSAVNSKCGMTSGHSAVLGGNPPGASISYHTLTVMESRLVPYFFINHPTRGTLAGPFKKLLSFPHPSSSSPKSSSTAQRVCLLVLDVIATLLGLDKTLTPGGVSKEAEALEKAVDLSLADESTGLQDNALQAEMRTYWSHIVSIMKR